jgi:hypothetical protein
MSLLERTYLVAFTFAVAVALVGISIDTWPSYPCHVAPPSLLSLTHTLLLFLVLTPLAALALALVTATALVAALAASVVCFAITDLDVLVAFVFLVFTLILILVCRWSCWIMGSGFFGTFLSKQMV